MNILDNASLILTPNGYKASKLYSIVPTDGSGDMTFTRVTATATRVNPNGLIEVDAANIPRLDYLGGGCPKLLLEPQRTNVILRSEEFDNASWIKSGSGTGTAPVITSNAAISPDGTMDADKIDLVCPATGSSNWSWVYQSYTATINETYTITIYLKAATSNDVGKVIRFGYVSYFNITLTADWTRYTITSTAPSTGSFSAGFRLRGSESTSTTASFFAWGAQLEVGAYATSYIPTTTASVTRNGDGPEKTSISSLIGQTEGTMFADLNLDTRISYHYLFVRNAAVTNYIGIKITASQIGLEVVDTNVVQANINLTNSSTGRFKIALAYKANDFVCYINGVLIGTDTSGTVPACDILDLYYNKTNKVNLNSTVLWKTRLQNAELATLTAL